VLENVGHPCDCIVPTSLLPTAEYFRDLCQYESLFVKKLTDNHTHRCTHTHDKHNKNSRKKGKRIHDQYSDLKIRL